jgi:hypothetical protein
MLLLLLCGTGGCRVLFDWIVRFVILLCLYVSFECELRIGCLPPSTIGMCGIELRCIINFCVFPDTCTCLFLASLNCLVPCAASFGLVEPVCVVCHGVVIWGLYVCWE